MSPATATKSARTQLHASRIDLKEETRTRVVEFLNTVLASTLDLYTQVKQAHWNVRGIHFTELHKLFDEVADVVYPYVDEVAERITSLGGVAMGTIRMASEASELPEYSAKLVEGKDHVNAVADRLAAYGKLVREGIDQTDSWGDRDTADLMTEISRHIDQQLWFVEAHIQH